MTCLSYYEAYYHISVQELMQPLLEAFAEKDSGSVSLIPELCHAVGFGGEVGADMPAFTEAMRHAKTAP